MAKKILVVDDSKTEALRTRLILERDGFQVSVASDGWDGLTKAADEQPDLILLDTVMPQLNGLEACGLLKLDPKTNQIPILILPTKDETALMALSLTANYLLPKPYEPQQLVARVRQAADGGSHSSGDVALLQRQLVEQHEELERTRREIQTARESRSDFFANMSHELRTPLHEIIGMNDLLLGTKLEQEQQQYLNTARTSSNVLLSLISDVIEFSELEAGQLGLELKPFDFQEPIQRAVEMVSTSASEKGIALVSNISPELGRTLMGDANRLRQILGNVLSNAVKFTERGQVTISCQTEYSSDDKTTLHMCVTDTGIGIPADRLEIIFEPFQQADISATRRFGGLGMGLALAKKLTTLMGGRIWAESLSGQGSTFHIVLPFDKIRGAAQSPTASMAATRWPRPLRILVAEDSPTNQLIAKSSLGKAGHTVALAVNGAEAVRLYEQAREKPEQEHFELVLMDISMPEMDGLDATRLIRTREMTLGGHVLIVAMTAFATKEYHTKCFEAGMDAYVTKPVRIAELDATLEPLLRQSPPVLPVASVKSPAVETAPSAVDLNEALEVVGGDVDILREAATISLDEVPGELEALKRGVETRDAKIVEAKAHRLKGVVGNLGGLPACKIGQRLETLGERGELTDAGDVFNLFEQEIGRVVAFYKDGAWEQQARLLQEANSG